MLSINSVHLKCLLSYKKIERRATGANKHYYLLTTVHIEGESLQYEVKSWSVSCRIVVELNMAFVWPRP